jgi:hypothetical protein
MRYDDDEEDPKKPHPVWIGRKGTHAAADEDHAPREVEPGDKELDSRHHHMHVRC